MCLVEGRQRNDASGAGDRHPLVTGKQSLLYQQSALFLCLSQLASAHPACLFGFLLVSAPIAQAELVCSAVKPQS